MKIRCINLDWLELYCLEPQDKPLDADYFEANGYKVKRRAYGTPQYQEMFTIQVGGEDFLEVRRNAYSKKSAGGIFEDTACHLRLSNRTCYEVDPINHLRAFMVAHGYTYKSITRIDIALDFNNFDNGSTPEQFIDRYMKGKLAKVNQSNMSAHGADTWTERVVTSLKWGSPSSPVSTKMYNKSLEMKQKKDKEYIRQRWEEAGLDLSHDVWRIEFSLSSQMQTLQSLKSGEMFKKSILHYDTRERLLLQWFILYNKYFDFRTLKKNKTKDGKVILVRKYLCPRVKLFNVNCASEAYVPKRNITKLKRPDRIWKILFNRLQRAQEACTLTRQEKEATITVMAWICKRLQIDVYKYHQPELPMGYEMARIGAITSTGTEPMPDQFQKDYEFRVLNAICHKYGLRHYFDPCLPF